MLWSKDVVRLNKRKTLTNGWFLSFSGIIILWPFLIFGLQTQQSSHSKPQEDFFTHQNYFVILSRCPSDMIFFCNFFRGGGINILCTTYRIMRLLKVYLTPALSNTNRFRELSIILSACISTKRPPPVICWCNTWTKAYFRRNVVRFTAFPYYCPLISKFEAHLRI